MGRNAECTMTIRDRIKDFRRVPASSLRPSPDNWRTHPQVQRDALRGLLAEIGYAGATLCRELPDGSLEIIDGHLRAEEMGDREVPVLVTDLDEDEATQAAGHVRPARGDGPGRRGQARRPVAAGVDHRRGDRGDAQPTGRRGRDQGRAGRRPGRGRDGRVRVPADAGAGREVRLRADLLRQRERLRQPADGPQDHAQGGLQEQGGGAGPGDPVSGVQAGHRGVGQACR